MLLDGVCPFIVLLLKSFVRIGLTDLLLEGTRELWIATSQINGRLEVEIEVLRVLHSFSGFNFIIIFKAFWSIFIILKFVELQVFQDIVKWD